MTRGFRHRLFLLLHIGVVVSGGVAYWIEPAAWRAIAVTVGGSVLAALLCDRFARAYLRRVLGRLRRAAEDLARGRPAKIPDAQPGDDFYKLVSAIQHTGTRLAELTEEEKRLQDELRRHERLAFLGELAATVAHEVNNPLDGIQNCARILRRSLDDPQRAAQMIDLIDDGLARIDTIVRRLLALASDHGIRAAERPIGDVVRAALAATQDKLDAVGVSVRWLERTPNDRARIDAQLLEQVFVNLILNALESMPGGGTLEIAIRREPHADGHSPDRVCVDVRDHGAGIAPDVLPHIFEPFFTTRKSGRGTGLGLAIAGRIVEAHGGSIGVDTREHVGSTFTVRIPAIPSAPTRREAARAAAATPTK